MRKGVIIRNQKRMRDRTREDEENEKNKRR
jgi:hypothetical protein